MTEVGSEVQILARFQIDKLRLKMIIKQCIKKEPQQLNNYCPLPSHGKAYQTQSASRLKALQHRLSYLGLDGRWTAGSRCTEDRAVWMANKELAWLWIWDPLGGKPYENTWNHRNPWKTTRSLQKKTSPREEYPRRSKRNTKLQDAPPVKKPETWQGLMPAPLGCAPKRIRNKCARNSQLWNPFIWPYFHFRFEFQLHIQNKAIYTPKNGKGQTALGQVYCISVTPNACCPEVVNTLNLSSPDIIMFHVVFQESTWAP